MTSYCRTMSDIRMIFLLTITVFTLRETVAQRGSCGRCDPSTCDPPSGCLAGFVKDSCNCCYECGRREGERCDHYRLDTEGFGQCGDNLECRMRSDLDTDDSVETMCYCVHVYPLCGSDGITYENVCQLTEARYERRDGLVAVSRDPCRSAPTIVSPPERLRNATGSHVALVCEASGWPVPSIVWEIRNRTGIVGTLPGNDPSIVVQTRGGPGFSEMTSWLLFTSLAPKHIGRYICKAENDLGQVQASAQVFVIY